jgi:hypothetical protein
VPKHPNVTAFTQFLSHLIQLVCPCAHVPFLIINAFHVLLCAGVDIQSFETRAMHMLMAGYVTVPCFTNVSVLGWRLPPFTSQFVYGKQIVFFGGKCKLQLMGMITCATETYTHITLTMSAKKLFSREKIAWKYKVTDPDFFRFWQHLPYIRFGRIFGR